MFPEAEQSLHAGLRCVEDEGSVQLRGTLRAARSIVDRSDRCAGSGAGTRSVPAPGRRSVSGRRRARTVSTTGLTPPQSRRAGPTSVTIGGMRVATYNINGISARLPNLLRWLAETAPEGGCLQGM